MSFLDKLSDQQQLEIGDAAKRILTDPGFNRAVARVAAMYAEEWRLTAPADVETRELLYTKANVLDDVVIALKAVMDDGKVVANTRAQAKVRPIR